MQISEFSTFSTPSTDKNTEKELSRADLLGQRESLTRDRIAVDKKRADKKLRIANSRLKLSSRQEEISKVERKLQTLADEETCLASVTSKHRGDIERLIGELNGDQWFDSNLTTGFALTWIGDEGKVSALGDSGYAVYATFAHRLERLQQTGFKLLTHFRYTGNQLVINGDEESAISNSTTRFYLQDKRNVAMQLRGRADRIGTMDRQVEYWVEMGYNYISPASPELERTESLTWSVGLLVESASSINFQVNIGEEIGNDLVSTGSVAVGDLRWSF